MRRDIFYHLTCTIFGIKGRLLRLGDLEHAVLFCKHFVNGLRVEPTCSKNFKKSTYLHVGSHVLLTFILSEKLSFSAVETCLIVIQMVASMALFLTGTKGHLTRSSVSPTILLAQ